MLTRLHISTFIGLTIAVWLLALWIQGMPVLSADFVKPFGVVVGVITAVVALFNKYIMEGVQGMVRQAARSKRNMEG